MSRRSEPFDDATGDAPPSPTYRERPLRTRLARFVQVGSVFVVLVAAAGVAAVMIIRGRMDDMNRFVQLRDHVVAIERLAGDIRSDTDRVFFASQDLVDFAADDAGASADPTAKSSVGDPVSVALGEFLALQRFDVPADVHTAIDQLQTAFTAFGDAAVGVSSTAGEDQAAVMDTFIADAATLDQQVDAVLELVDDLVDDARARSDEMPARTAQVLIALVVATVIGLIGHARRVSRSIRDQLEQIADTSRAIAKGQLSARAEVTSDDELGELARAVNQMAADLQELVCEMEAAADRDAFAAQLGDALDMADTEPAALRVVERAMRAIAPDGSIELLVADSSKAHLSRVAVSPDAPAPCCPVESPFACAAVRRGNPMAFPDSEALNACPNLRGRAAGEVAAVCAPVTFMGRALGVLHATTAPDTPLDAVATARLGLLAGQAGARIGTIRSFERSQLQARTDGLTGLRNRRTLESEIRGLLAEHRSLALVMADLDHFKKLNDTFGHDAGDRALRRFARCMIESVRESDIMGRLGGEEFVLALPDTSVEVAEVMMGRLRAALVESSAGDTAPAVTASFGIVHSTQGGSLDELLKIADVALYRAKQEGRDRIVLANCDDVATAAAGSLRSGVEPPRRGPADAFVSAAELDDPMPLAGR